MSIRATLAACTLAACALTAPDAHATGRWTQEFTANLGGWNVENYPRMTGDINGDGRADVIGFGHWGVHVALSTGQNFGPGRGWSGEFCIAHGGWYPSAYPRRVADVNGDGYDDVIGFGHWGVSVALSDGERLLPAGFWYGDFGYDRGWRTDVHERRVADVNGDGRADLVGFGQQYTFVALSTGNGFGPMQIWSNDFSATQGYHNAYHTRELGDVNGDGRADVIAFHHWGVNVAFSTGTSFAPAHFAFADMGWSHRGYTANAPRTVADVDGDGRVDLVNFIDQGVYVALSNGYTFDRSRVWLDTYGAWTGWAPRHVRVMADVDGDGRADAIGFADDAVRVALARADRFDDLFLPLSGGDFATRLKQVSKGMCLSSQGDLSVSQRPCDAQIPLGWILEARPDGTYLIMQNGHCLAATHAGVPADGTWVEAATCGQALSRWYVERNADGRLRLRNAQNGKCLRVPGETRNDGERTFTVACDASDHQLFEADSIRPRTMTSPLRFGHSGKCISTVAGWSATQRTCDGGPHQTFTLTDDGHGSYMARNHANDRCLTQAAPGRGNWLVSEVCNPADIRQRLAIKDLGGGQRLFVSQQTGLCLDVTGSQGHDGAQIIYWDCHGDPNQRLALPDVGAAGVVEFSLQNVGGPGGTALVIANQQGAYVTRDPVAITAFLRNSGATLTHDDFLALFSPPQHAEFNQRVGAWDAPLPDEIAASAQVVTIAGDYSIGPDGADLGLSASAVQMNLTIGGVARTEVKLLSADARVTVRNDGVAFGPSAEIIGGEAGFGDPDGSYAGIGGGFGSRGFSVAARWGQDGQYGVTVPLGVVAVDLYVSGDDVITAAVFAADVGEWVGNAAADAFSSAFGWAGGAFNTAVNAIGSFFDDVGGFFEDVGDWFGGWF